MASEKPTLTRRQAFLSGAALLAGGASYLAEKQAEAQGKAPAPDSAPPPAKNLGYVPVVMPNGTTLPWTMEDGYKTFRITAEKVKREFAPGMIVNAWGYNGQCPGPVIEAMEGDKVRFYVTNKLPERTSMHWHGVLLPNGMDGVAGLTQPHIEPGETYVYEFTLRQHGTLMYHPHSDEMVQMAMGMVGFFIIHPKRPERPAPDRDFCIMLQEWFIPPGGATPNPMVMLDFNNFTFNAKAWPGTAPLVVKTGQRVRIRYGNVTMDNHPIHLHGHNFEVAATDGGRIPKAARWRETTVDVPVGTTRDIEFTADAPGDWILHCHKSHHTMNAMSHDVPNMIGVDQKGVEEKVRKQLPGYMAMGETGMGNMMDMGRPKNTLPMMAGKGKYGPIEMGGMFTILKVRDGLKTYDDPGFYDAPADTRARKVKV